MVPMENGSSQVGCGVQVQQCANTTWVLCEASAKVCNHRCLVSATVVMHWEPLSTEVWNGSIKVVAAKEWYPAAKTEQI